jgi:hypothetical protein
MNQTQVAHLQALCIYACKLKDANQDVRIKSFAQVQNECGYVDKHVTLVSDIKFMTTQGYHRVQLIIEFMYKDEDEELKAGKFYMWIDDAGQLQGDY